MNKLRAIIGVVLFAGNAAAQDIRTQEVMVVDQACIERKILACAFEQIPTVPGNFLNRGNCPDGSEWTGKTESPPSPPGGFPTSYKVCKIKTVALLLQQPSLHDVLSRCRILAESLPSVYGGESCLKPLAQERIYNAITVDMKQLIKQLCEVSNNPKCDELDKVPQ